VKLLDDIFSLFGKQKEQSKEQIKESPSRKESPPPKLAPYKFSEYDPFSQIHGLPDSVLQAISLQLFPNGKYCSADPNTIGFIIWGHCCPR